MDEIYRRYNSDTPDFQSVAPLSDRDTAPQGISGNDSSARRDALSADRQSASRHQGIYPEARQQGHANARPNTNQGKPQNHDAPPRSSPTAKSANNYGSADTTATNRPKVKRTYTVRRKPLPPPKQKASAKKSPKSIFSLLNGFIPPSLYNAETKKLLGHFSTEDLLLAALIFLFFESGSDEGLIMALVLLYVLVSEYIELPDFLL